ncbi:hypothetical protein [Pseudoxanthomonas winnipegensis]|uniref:Ankyrin repeat domain-containing protein n=1 Tax=Pseudoxanthomonas winnipegensis TaxID=2480810 RepID=A0A4Q8M564_9GAMM|nr:hypothetical protein [Pseudoxanthomonas winnipegensis]TAA41539.1 hypothetical protein EA655_11395 [Pseudoxanthomonas winnipegensis]
MHMIVQSLFNAVHACDLQAAQAALDSLKSDLKDPAKVIAALNTRYSFDLDVTPMHVAAIQYKQNTMRRNFAAASKANDILIMLIRAGATTCLSMNRSRKDKIQDCQSSGQTITEFCIGYVPPAIIDYMNMIDETDKVQRNFYHQEQNEDGTRLVRYLTRVDEFGRSIPDPNKKKDANKKQVAA